MTVTDEQPCSDGLRRARALSDDSIKAEYGHQGSSQCVRGAVIALESALNVLSGGAKLDGMHALKAHVKNGQIVLDEPAELPEGAPVDVLVHGADPHDE